MKVSKYANENVRCISGNASVSEASETLAELKIGAMLILEGNQPAGIISEQDIVRKVIAKRKDPATVKVSEVMTAPVKTTSLESGIDECLSIMQRGNFRHLPLTGTDGSVVGIVSVRDLLFHRVEQLSLETKDLQNYIMADGPGG